MVTIKDVARDAGVSVGTVSNVLNGGRVSEARRKLVEASIEKLGYQVNTLAKGMRMQKTDYVVVILPNLINPYFALLLDAWKANCQQSENRYCYACPVMMLNGKWHLWIWQNKIKLTESLV